MSERLVPPDAKGALIAAVVFTTIGLAVGGVGINLVIVPLVYVCVVYAATRVPLRYSLYTLMALALTLENPAEAPSCGYWRSPLYPVGALLLNHMNAFSDIKPLIFSGMDLCLGALLLIGLYRSGAKRSVDARGRIETPKPLLKLAYLSIVAMGLVWVGGLLRGGDFGMSLWQLDRVMYLPVIFLLFSMALRGPQDHEALAKIVLGAGVFRALAAVLISHFIRLPEISHLTGTNRLPHATSHHDSILFACGFLLLLVMVLERVGKHHIRRALFLFPILALGIWANNRRMAWVHVGLTFLTLYFMTPDNRAKRLLRKAIVYSAPIAAIYVMVGWNSGSRVFKPVRVLRTVIDSKSDDSTLWRDLENHNLILTLRNHPVLGAGYGHGFEEVITMPAIDYDLERFVPHNSLLGLWAFAGPLGFSGLTLLWGGGVFFAMRAYHAAKDNRSRAAGLVAACTVLIYLIQCWGDMGLGTWTGVFTMAPALAVAGKLAVATGGWATKKKAPPAVARRPEVTC